MMGQRLFKKIFHVCMIFVIIVIIGFIAVMVMLNYGEKGETDMPFSISKIAIISTVNGEDVEDVQNKWNFNVTQNNDIYIYIDKNEKHKKQEIISSVVLDNFKVKLAPECGKINFYKPSLNDNSLFKNSDENVAEKIEFKGEKTTDMRNLQISNQGGTIAFRTSNLELGNYISNDEEQVNHNELLKKMNIDENNLKYQISLDVTLNLNSGTVFKAEQITIELPIENVVDLGTVGKEITDMNTIRFKRIEN